MNDLPEVYRELAGRFDESADVVREGATLEEVKNYVRMHVSRLLDSNPGLLMSILYRIDVSETHVQDVLKRAAHDEIPDRLTELIIERQLQKLRLRRKYGSPEDADRD